MRPPVGTAVVIYLTSTAARSPNSSLPDWQTQCLKSCLINGKKSLAVSRLLTLTPLFASELRPTSIKAMLECYLRDPRVAESVQNSFLFFDGKRYRLTAWVIMPNHAHMLLTPCAGHELSDILHSLKSYTANEANKLLGREGQFWQPESFDRWVRDADHFAKVIAYIENNPVKARLCKKPEDWPYSSAWFRKRGLK
jgi:REP element-mobilizing transposase RayT